ncbi:MAG TPA: zinc-ribbon domain-containing protein [Pyrinomonadaceae bacterium]
MYCPKCGAENIDDAKFCRGCGTDIGLVPQALTGHLPEKRAVGYDAEGQPYDETGRRIRRENEPARIDKAITRGFIGLAFLIIAVIIALSGADRKRDWWFWLLIPAFTLIGGGVAEYIRFKLDKGTEKRLPEVQPKTAMQSPARVSALPRRNTSELVPPPSVTEGTTRHLDLSRESVPRAPGAPLENQRKDV